MKPGDKAHKRYIGIRQAKRTIQLVAQRARRGTPRPNDKQTLIDAQRTLAKWESSPVK